jgi:hypothetical protein
MSRVGQGITNRTMLHAYMEVNVGRNGTTTRIDHCEQSSEKLGVAQTAWKLGFGSLTSSYIDPGFLWMS